MLAWSFLWLAVWAPVQLEPPDGIQLIRAVRAEDESEVRALLSAGAEIDATDDVGRSALFHAAASGNAAIVSLLIDGGADVSLQDAEGVDPLTVAKAYGHEPVVERLRAAGATESLEFLLMQAVRDDALSELESLIAKGANVDALDTEDYQTPLMAAVRLRRLEILLRLVEAGADPSIEGTGIGTTGENAISFASREASPWALRVLLEAGARQADKDRALLLGCDVRAVVDVAVESGAKVDARDGRGQTPLICAAARGAADAVRSLLSAGARTDTVDDEGRTALDWARQNGHQEVQALLSR